MTASSDLDPLGAALGTCLSQIDGLGAVYLPEGVSESIAVSIVRRANALRPSLPSFAILVGPTDDLGVADVPRVTTQRSIQYRRGDRLAVVVGPHTDIASFMQAFRDEMSPSYPAGEGQRVSLHSVASAWLVDTLLPANKIVDSYFDVADATSRLAACFAQLREMHEELGQGSRGWNAYWFDHVSGGLARLGDLVSGLRNQKSSLSLDEVFARYTYAAFGLPRPRDGKLLRAGQHVGRATKDALSTWWSDQGTIQTTVQQLAHHPDNKGGEQHPLLHLDWTGFNRSLAAEGNHLLALAKLVAVQGSKAFEAFANFTEGQFFDPLSTLSKNGQLWVSGLEGQDLAIGSAAEVGPFLLQTESVGHPDGVQTEVVRVRVPTLARPSQALVDASSLTITPSAPAVSWHGKLELGHDGTLWAIGSLVRALGRPPHTRPVLSFRLRLAVTAHDSLAGFVDTSATGEVILLPPVGRGLIFLRSRAGGLGRATYVGLESYDLRGVEPVQEPRYSEELDDDKAVHQVLLWTASRDDSVRYEERVVPPFKNRVGVYGMSMVPKDVHEFYIAETMFELSSPRSSDVYRSPIVAAIDQQLLSADKPSEATQDSVRGRYEQVLAAQQLSPDWRASLGHLMVSESDQTDIMGSGLVNGVLVGRGLQSAVRNVVGFTVPPALADSSEVEAFLAAFDALGVPEALSIGTDEELQVEWPSRTSWRHLWQGQRDQLAAYLDAYVEMVKVASEIGDPHGVFWATYPFSISVWDLESTGTCRAVMLSPLHPIRLSWLAGAEAVLWDASDARFLAGTVEGWNFPIFGPSETDRGKLIAIPADSGEGQVFLGWSMMVQASVNGYLPLSPPVTVAGMPAPGSSVSGLNATAAAAALRSYQRMHPQVSTLTVDLAAGSPTARLEEVDVAVLRTVREWAKGQASRLSGGVRVWDSINREGAAPRELVAEVARDLAGVPISWSRYSVSASDPQKLANIRLLQDSGIRVEAGEASGVGSGIIGGVPLRRFEAHESQSTSLGYSETRPSVMAGGWPHFLAALQACEGVGNGSRLRSKLFKAALIDGTAEWTVSGEAMMSPSAMASLVHSESRGSQMLWEWQPPFLEAADHIPVLERRPFVSIARVPGSFKGQLKDLLEKATGGSVSETSIEALLAKLGARGVGLSSLLSMGGTHAAGALGFYLTFCLMDLLPNDGIDQFVLPIDACDSFLRALGGGEKASESTRRADLLVMRLSDDALTLIPLEIKLYGLVGAERDHRLPVPGESILNEPLEQLHSTRALLEKLVNRAAVLQSNSSSADLQLWNNGLASLVEAGARLRPYLDSPTGRLAQRLKAVVDGDLELRIGAPLISFFQHKGESREGSRFEAHIDQHDATGSPFGAFIANIGSVFESVESTERQDAHDRILSAWGELLAWSETGLVRPGAPAAGSSRTGAANFSDDNPVDNATEVTETGAYGLVDLGPDGLPPRDATIRAGEGVRFDVGTLLGTVGGGRADFWPGNTALNQMNIGVVGDLGTGKTELLKALVGNLRDRAKATQINPLSFLILDYKRDYQTKDFMDRVGATVLLPNRIPLNIFALAGEYTRLAAFQKAQEFSDVISKIYGGVGPVQKSRFARVTVELFESNQGRPPTLAQVADAYRVEVPNGDSVTAVLDTFVYGEIFSSDHSELVTFDELIHDKVLVVAIDRLGVDQKSKNALVVLFLNMYYDFMLRAQKFPFEGTDPQVRRLSSFILVDEATNIMEYDFQVLMSLMLQGRQFGFGTILASQYLSHFKTSKQNYGQPLLTWFIHKVPTVTPQELAKLGILGLPDTASSRIAELGTHELLYKSLGFEGSFVRGTPFYEWVKSHPTLGSPNE